ncbi:MAG: hypothetical protein A2Z25_02840 [Planctomycetes bacterium RBG_16_55_9]|nr:MAG: hypothetical protein A2Z25_02840 [Planctomycetes bacterium RBG_16_55_9]
MREESRKAADAILGLTNAFCREHLNEEYRELCEDMVVELLDIDVPLGSGKPAGWACGIVHAVGFVNFLHDPSQSPHMTSVQLAEGFGVSQQTMQAKSKIIRDELDLMQMDPDWCLTSLREDNPLVWMVSLNGFIADVRYLPRETQEEAYRLGLIPYIPADRKPPEPEPSAEPETKVIQFPSGQSEAATAKSARKQKDDGPTLFDGTER